MLYFYTADSSVGLFTEASPQTHEEYIAQQPYDGSTSLGNRNFSAPL